MLNSRLLTQVVCKRDTLVYEASYKSETRKIKLKKEVNKTLTKHVLKRFDAIERQIVFP